MNEYAMSSAANPTPNKPKMPKHPHLTPKKIQRRKCVVLEKVWYL
jgi:hypothetical protein